MTRKLASTCVLLLALLHIAAPAHAYVERDCLVAQQARSGWSKDHKRTIYFMTGLELSRITTVLKIDFGQVYAVIMYETGLPSVLRLDTVLPGLRREFTAADFVRLFVTNRELVGTQLDGEGRDLKWRVRARTLDSWVDDDMPSLGLLIQ